MQNLKGPKFVLKSDFMLFLSEVHYLMEKLLNYKATNVVSLVVLTHISMVLWAKWLLY